MDFYIYCPDMTSVALAQLYGVSFILEHQGDPAPTGAVFDKSIGSEDLYRIPGSPRATLSALEPNGNLPPVEATGTPVAASQPNPSSWKVTTDASTKEVLRLRITNVPGWSATIDGRPLALVSYAGVMLQAVVPPGDHTIVLQYWPKDFTDGLFLAGIAALGLLTSLVVVMFRRRRRPA